MESSKLQVNNIDKLKLIIYVFILYAVVNLIYIINFSDDAMNTREKLELTVDLIFKVILFISINIKTKYGWWAIVAVSFLSIIYVVPTTLYFESGGWLYMYLSFIVFIYGFILSLISIRTVKKIFSIDEDNYNIVFHMSWLFLTLSSMFVFVAITGEHIISIFLGFVVSYYIKNTLFHIENASCKKLE